jgi:glycosyltransferase involved in cell wall biosynthesis
MTKDPGPFLSIVVPMFNEAENIEPLLIELDHTLAALGQPAEILIVDDGSTDRTREILRASLPNHRSLRLIGLAHRHGQAAALRVGIERSKGLIIATLDGDGQNPPADILSLVDELQRTGADMVVGWRRTRRDRLLSKRFPSRVANGLVRIVTGTPIHDTGCTLKAMRGPLARKIPLPAGMHRFIPALARNYLGGTVVEIEVDHRPRRAGQSKYGWSRLLPVLRDIVIVGRLSFPGWLITRLAEFLVLFSLLRWVGGLDPFTAVAGAVMMGSLVSILCWRRLHVLPTIRINEDSAADSSPRKNQSH